MNLYAYCLADSSALSGEATPSIESLEGIGGSGLRLIRYGHGVAAVVSDFADERAPVTRENVLRHNEVASRVLAETTPLPFRFGNVVSAAELERYVGSNRNSILRALEHVRGCAEMSVKIIWDVEAARRLAEREAEGSSQKGAGGRLLKAGAAEGRGTAFLRAKLRAELSDEALEARAEAVAAWLAERAGGAVRDSRVSVRPREPLVVRAAHLVERERAGEYRALVEAARRERGPELHFLTSGAWPPYSFTDISS